MSNGIVCLLEVWKILDHMMHCNAGVEDSVSVHRQSIIESLPLMLVVNCLASAGQYSYSHRNVAPIGGH